MKPRLHARCPNHRAIFRILATLLVLAYGQGAFAETRHSIPLMPPASNPIQQGFVRIINHSHHPGLVHIHAIDDTGRRFGPIPLLLDAAQTAHFNSHDLEHGNADKKLFSGVGDGDGDWRLELRTDLDIQPLAYIRTSDGFLSTMHEVIGEQDVGADPYYRYEARVPIFNPASNANQVSRLRIINPGETIAEVEVHGVDDAGNDPPRGYVLVSIPPGGARNLTASDIEQGGDFAGHFGDGSGKWRIVLRSTTPGIQAMSLLQSPTGNLTNLSIGRAAGSRTIPLFISASHPVQQSFVRIINHSPSDGGTVRIYAIDDAGRRVGPVFLEIGPGKTRHVNSQDLERGNPEKGLSAGVGPGVGNWRLEIKTTLDMEPLAYIRTSDGFLTSMHEVASGEETSMRKTVPIFNPGSNENQRSLLRLVNPQNRPATVFIRAQDDRGNFAPQGDVTLTVPARGAQTWSARQLEDGDAGFSGRFGDGQGKWRLFVSAMTPIQVMSLLQNPAGHLTNLSGAPPVTSLGNSAPVAHDVPVSHDMTIPYANVQLIGTDRDNDTLQYVLDGPRNGPGYRDAFVEPDVGRLYAQLTSTPSNRVEISYKVTDGLEFSNSANVTITIAAQEGTSLGANPTSPQTYGSIPTGRHDYRGLPRKVDLSGNFPEPGAQRGQNSCVGWATAYALKSYQERRSERWAFTDATTFSPAWIYNQIRERTTCADRTGAISEDCGAYIHNALDLMRNRGTATWATMPYDENDFRTQPGPDAIRDAERYKSGHYARLDSLLDIKASLHRRRPVVLALRIYDGLNSGTVVYNDYSGPFRGGHAVTLVGYDDDKYGGAFHAMNSWGAEAHEDGFFWFPYSAFNAIGWRHVVMEAYRLSDRANENVPRYIPNPEPCLRGESLPNLQPAGWGVASPPNATAAVWVWVLINTGLGSAPAGVQVDLIISEDDVADASDIVMTSEVIPEPIGPGDRVNADLLREESFFYLPSEIPPGDYYLGMWVDSPSRVRECVEHDNVLLQDEKGWTMPEDLPDLALVSWDVPPLMSDEGTLEFTIANVGRADVGLDDEELRRALLANLVLHKDINPFALRADGSFDLYTLTWTEIPFLSVNESFSVGGASTTAPVAFNLTTTALDEPIPAGEYYMSMLVDTVNLLLESNEHNNAARADNQVCTPREVCDLGIFNAEYRRHSIERGSADVEQGSGWDSSSGYFNGKRLPHRLTKRVQISAREDGTREMRLLDVEDGPSGLKLKGKELTLSDEDVVPPYFEKFIESSNAVIFPEGNVIRLK